MTVARAPRLPIVPRLVLPVAEHAVSTTQDDVNSPSFKRQITVALGRSHSQRTPRRDVIFRIHHGGMIEKQPSSARTEVGRGNKMAPAKHSPLDLDRSVWTTTSQSVAPAFSPSRTVEPHTTWFECADKVFRFYGHIVDQPNPVPRQAPANVRLVTIHYYPQDSSLEMLESRETATPGVGRMLALRRPARVSLGDIKVGSDVLINGTRVRVYDADAFTRRCVPGLRPKERAPCPDKTCPVTPRGAAVAEEFSDSSCQGFAPKEAEDGGFLVTSPAKTAVVPAPDATIHGSPSMSRAGWRTGVASGDEDAPEVLRLYMRWDDPGCASSPVHRYIVKYFLEDGTIEMRELADTRGGHHHQGHFPVVIRRQRVFKGGASPSLGVDNIGGDFTTPRSARAKPGAGRDGGHTGWREQSGGLLCPQDMVVGQTVSLMKKPMIVCGWDEISHAWWEQVTGMNMRGMQGDLEEFRRCMRPSRTHPRPPNKSKSSFYEGPPQKPRTVRGRFLKASENTGKTLRFLAKATTDTQTPSTRDNIFIIRFYPEDDTISVYTSHTLGCNSGGVFKGIYLARKVDPCNEDTGEAFKAGDFCIGYVAKLPSISLRVVDVDDFTRHFLAHEVSPPDARWHTGPVWAKLSRMLASPSGASNKSEWRGGESGRNIADKGFETCSGTSDEQGPLGRDTYRNAAHSCGEGVREEADALAFADLWTECLGNRGCSEFPADRSACSDSNNNDCGESKGFGYPGTRGSALGTGSHGPREPQADQHSHVQRDSSTMSAWKRLVSTLRGRGVDVAQALTPHERMLLERELADRWQGAGRGVGRGQGMAERLASAAAAAHDAQPLLHPGVRPKEARWSSSTDTFDSRERDCNSDVDLAHIAVVRAADSGDRDRNATRCPSSVTAAEYPAVVVEAPTAGQVEAGQGTTSDGASSNTGPGEQTRAQKERVLDLRSVALDAHEAPASGRDDRIVRGALKKVLAGVFGQGGETMVRKTLKFEGKTPGDPADLWTTSRVLMVVAGLSCRDTEALWLKFMPAAVAKAGQGGRVTFSGFLESIRTFEECLRRGEMLGLSNTGQNPNCAGLIVGTA